MKHYSIAAVEPPAGVPPELPLGARRRILMVEADPELRTRNTGVLLRLGHRVDAVSQRSTAWAALHHRAYDLLITENQPPRLTGVKLLRKLHASRRHLPVIFLSGMAPTVELNRHPHLQPAATLFKPHTGEELSGAVQEVLELHATHPTPQAPRLPPWP
jgi:DNA-binding response OmpR family regulator